jgi:hypothetical protein
VIRCKCACRLALAWIASNAPLCTAGGIAQGLWLPLPAPAEAVPHFLRYEADDVREAITATSKLRPDQVRHFFTYEDCMLRIWVPQLCLPCSRCLGTAIVARILSRAYCGCRHFTCQASQP